MAARKHVEVEQPQRFSYRYEGDQAVTFTDLTGQGIGLVEPGTVLDVEAPIAHPHLHPTDDVTVLATAALYVAQEPQEQEEPAEAAEAAPGSDTEPSGPEGSQNEEQQP